MSFLDFGGKMKPTVLGLLPLETELLELLSGFYVGVLTLGKVDLHKGIFLLEIKGTHTFVAVPYSQEQVRLVRALSIVLGACILI